MAIQAKPGQMERRRFGLRSAGERGWRLAVAERIDHRRLAVGLGWLSIGLGAAEMLAPRTLARTIGVRGDQTRLRLLRLMGLREIASGVGILATRRPTAGLWSRVAGDVIDLALLGAAARSRGARRGRVATAIAAVLGVTVIDALASRQLSGDGATARGPRRAALRRSIAIMRSPEELYRFWRDFSNLARFMRHIESVQVTGERRSHWRARGPGDVPVEWDAEITEDWPNQRIAWRTVEGSPVHHAGVVRFDPAPGRRGTLVIVEMEYAPPGGVMTATMAKLFGQAPEQLIQDDLRRFKQLMETGEVLVAEGVLRGVAQPLESAPSGRTAA